MIDEHLDFQVLTSEPCKPQAKRRRRRALDTTMKLRTHPPASPTEFGETRPRETAELEKPTGRINLQLVTRTHQRIVLLFLLK